MFFCLLTWLSACQSNDENETLKRGEILAKMKCSGCHLLPAPELLDKKTWREGVLPAMAAQFGIEVLQGNFYLNTPNSTLSNKDWLKIVSYYETLAPDSLQKQPVKRPVANDWFIFKLKKPVQNPSQIANTLMTVINSDEKAIYTSNLTNPGLYKWDQNLKPRMLTTLTSSPVDIIFNKPSDSIKSVVTCMGGMQALDVTKGDVISLTKNEKGDYSKDVIGADFIRPIQSRPADFNKDGLTDYVICSFGHHKGGLFLLRQRPDKTFDRSPIREIPGATQAVINDFNHDGWLDIMALFAHGDEGIWLFTNDKKGGFETKNILRFPPVYGSGSFQIADMNQDGKPDIVYTAGDNSDYSRILKPYHGLYIFLNRGDFDSMDLQFEQSYFYPLYGCTKAIAADMDQDGDMDIAAIAFFADFKNNQSDTFMFFENNTERSKKTLYFKPHNLPVSKNGRWICMDVNDYDGDGDKDIILGNYSKGFMNQENIKPDWDIHTPFVVLENIVK